MFDKDITMRGDIASFSPQTTWSFLQLPHNAAHLPSMQKQKRIMTSWKFNLLMNKNRHKLPFQKPRAKKNLEKRHIYRLKSKRHSTRAYHIHCPLKCGMAASPKSMSSWDSSWSMSISSQKNTNKNYSNLEREYLEMNRWECMTERQDELNSISLRWTRKVKKDYSTHTSRIISIARRWTIWLIDLRAIISSNSDRTVRNDSIPLHENELK